MPPRRVAASLPAVVRRPRTQARPRTASELARARRRRRERRRSPAARARPESRDGRRSAAGRRWCRPPARARGPRSRGSEVDRPRARCRTRLRASRSAQNSSASVEPTRQTIRWTDAVASSAGSGVRELEEGEVGARISLLVGVEQVVDARVVLVHGLLHHAQAHQAGVEVDVALGIGRDARDVVDAFELHAFDDSAAGALETPVRQTGTPQLVRSRLARDRYSRTPPEGQPREKA